MSLQGVVDNVKTQIKEKKAQQIKDLTPSRRGLDQTRLNELKRLIMAQTMGIQTGFKNQSDRTLLQGGLGRSGRRFTNTAAAASAASKFGADANRGLAALDEQTASSNFNIDRNFLLQVQQMNLAAQARKRANKFNPLKAAIDIGKFAVPFIPGIGPAATAGAAATNFQ